MSTLPSFEEVHLVLSYLNAEMDAAEMHGMLCGFICAGQKMDGSALLSPILGGIGDSPSERKYQQVLIDVYDASVEQLKSMNFDFQMLLPDDDAPLPNRAEALGEWCQGFLAGLGLAQVKMEEGKSKESREAMNHIAEISQIDYENLSICEEDEKAYAEVLEYVRMAVLMVFTELSGQADVHISEDTDRVLH
jgi:uncharacterized protein